MLPLSTTAITKTKRKASNKKLVDVLDPFDYIQAALEREGVTEAQLTVQQVNHQS